MVQSQGIDVYLAPFSDITKRYPEYAVPIDSSAYTNDPNEVYIEAVDGERFAIVVDLLEHFDRQQSKMLKISLNVDGNRCSDAYQYDQLSQTKLGDTPIKGRDVTTWTERKIDGRWVKCGLMFAPLEIDEDMEMDEERVSQNVDIHGKIVVKIQRGEVVKPVEETTEWPLSNGYHVPETQFSSKEVIKDNHVSHSIRHLAIENTTPPIRWLRAGERWKPIRGQGGVIIRFTVRYRSRDALQKLKIIPKDKTYIDFTSSPPPSPQVKAEVESTIKSELHEDVPIVDAARQGPNNVSPEDTETHAPACASASSPNAARTMGGGDHAKKRKALEDELRDVELEQKRLRLMRELAEMDEAEK